MPTLTAAELTHLRRKLEDERRRILRVLAEEVPTLAPEDIRVELEESAQRITERDLDNTVHDRERALLAEVEAALARLDAGTYGRGERSGEDIPWARLNAMPWARDVIDA